MNGTSALRPLHHLGTVKDSVLSLFPTPPDREGLKVQLAFHSNEEGHIGYTLHSPLLGRPRIAFEVTWTATTAKTTLTAKQTLVSHQELPCKKSDDPRHLRDRIYLAYLEALFEAKLINVGASLEYKNVTFLKGSRQPCPGEIAYKIDRIQSGSMSWDLKAQGIPNAPGTLADHYRFQEFFCATTAQAEKRLKAGARDYHFSLPRAKLQHFDCFFSLPKPGPLPDLEAIQSFARALNGKKTPWAENVIIHWERGPTDKYLIRRYGGIYVVQCLLEIIFPGKGSLGILTSFAQQERHPYLALIYSLWELQVLAYALKEKKYPKCYNGYCKEVYRIVPKDPHALDQESGLTKFVASLAESFETFLNKSDVVHQFFGKDFKNPEQIQHITGYYLTAHYTGTPKNPSVYFTRTNMFEINLSEYDFLSVGYEAQPLPQPHTTKELPDLLACQDPRRMTTASSRGSSTPASQPAAQAATEQVAVSSSSSDTPTLTSSSSSLFFPWETASTPPSAAGYEAQPLPQPHTTKELPDLRACQNPSRTTAASGRGSSTPAPQPAAQVATGQAAVSSSSSDTPTPTSYSPSSFFPWETVSTPPPAAMPSPKTPTRGSSSGKALPPIPPKARGQ